MTVCADLAQPVATAWSVAMHSKDLAGKWTYRSFRNNPAPTNGDPELLAKLLFAEAEFTFEVSSETTMKGIIDWGGHGLDLTGSIQPASGDAPLTLAMVGLGRAGPPGDPGSTEGWEYDYHAYAAHEWPNGVNQAPALVGSVIRVKPHGGAPAGYVASFIAVKQSSA